MKTREFYILALSQKNVKLFQCTFDDIKEIHTGNIISDYYEMEKGFRLEKQLQSHGSSGVADRGGKRMFHGHGVGTNFHKDTMLHFFHVVSKEIEKLLFNKNAPLILATVDYLIPIYLKANKYPHLLEATIKGNPDRLNMNSLHDKALQIARNYFNKLERES